MMDINTKNINTKNHRISWIIIVRTEVINNNFKTSSSFRIRMVWEVETKEAIVQSIKMTSSSPYKVMLITKNLQGILSIRTLLRLLNLHSNQTTNKLTKYKKVELSHRCLKIKMIRSSKALTI
jgi:mannose/fructose/N-acetylgalactosamine-specific phosphotransferase system component IIB